MVLEKETVSFIIERDTTSDEQMSQLKMMMAMSLAKRLGKVGIDMKIDKEEHESCDMLTVPHFHLTGYLNDES